MSSSPAKDAEKGPATVAADEVELARMGYKQELKFVHVSVGWCRVLTVSLSRRRELGLMQVHQFLVSVWPRFHELFLRTLVYRSPLSAS